MNFNAIHENLKILKDVCKKDSEIPSCEYHEKIINENIKGFPVDTVEKFVALNTI